MTAIIQLQELEARALAAGLSRRKWLKRAEVAQSTFYRAKSGKTGLLVSTLEKLANAIPHDEVRPS